MFIHLHYPLHTAQQNNYQYIQAPCQPSFSVDVDCVCVSEEREGDTKRVSIVLHINISYPPFSYISLRFLPTKAVAHRKRKKRKRTIYLIVRCLGLTRRIFESVPRNVSHNLALQAFWYDSANGLFVMMSHAFRFFLLPPTHYTRKKICITNHNSQI